MLCGMGEWGGCQTLNKLLSNLITEHNGDAEPYDLSQFFLEWQMFQKNVVYKVKNTDFMFTNFFFFLIFSFMS
jgi:hypothetical protein